MFAVVRINDLDPDRPPDDHGQLEEFERQHSAQPGYRGTISVALDENRQLVVNLWDTEDDAAQARSVMSAIAGRLVEPRLARPSVLAGAGPVLAFDLRPAPEPDPDATGSPSARPSAPGSDRPS